LRRLGYEKDYLGNNLKDLDQVIELQPQDIVIPDSAASYLFRVTKFIDSLLDKLYGLPAFYNLSANKDLLGHLIVGLAPHTSAGVVGRVIGFTKAHVIYAHPFWHANKRRNADGDEDAIMLLSDVLLNFSRYYLPEKRGGKMDAPLVVTTLLNPWEVDDEAHKMETVFDFSLKFYESTLEGKRPSEVDVECVANRLREDPYTGFGFTHSTEDVTGSVVESNYVRLTTMQEKITSQLQVAEKSRAIDEREVAQLILQSHFLRDTYGNLRAFTRQKFRCVKCNAKYRRVPLRGKCTKCGGKLLLTVSKGNIIKYLETSQNLAEKYDLSNYLKQRLNLIHREVDSLFINDKNKQVSIADFM
ncbi:MAG: DNA polymerase II large subunit, partial [Candidatus Altiarchaeales archaeon]|nr:DNA polymerase II large subunit [Candidatus Altiarchaeales archaeon]